MISHMLMRSYLRMGMHMRWNTTHRTMKACASTAFGLLTVAGLFTTQATAASPSDRHYVVAERSGPGAPPPFSEGVVVGDTLYIAGHIGIDPKTGKAPDDPQQEARLVMDAIQHAVTSAGFQMSDVVSMEVFCTDLRLYDTFNAVYRTYFSSNYPARAFIGAHEILRGGHFEVLGIAVRNAKK
jgi:2-iminobutanoate/2-iminopropanoate deaminase